MSMATPANWPSSGCPARRRNNRGTSRGSAKRWCGCARGCRRRGADCWSVTARRRRRIGGGRRRGTGWAKSCPPGCSSGWKSSDPFSPRLDTQIAALSHELEAAAPPDLPRGLGKLTSVALSREVCDWRRFHNRRGSPTHLPRDSLPPPRRWPAIRASVPANTAAATNGCKAV